MKLYKKQIRAMISPPVLQGCNSIPIPYSDWIDESKYSLNTKKQWEQEIKEKDSWNSLTIEERYVPVGFLGFHKDDINWNDESFKKEYEIHWGE